MMTHTVKQTEASLVSEGEKAFVSGVRAKHCPYDKGSTMANLWLQGWWKAFYTQRDVDTKRIAYWLENHAPVELMMDVTRALSIAYLITSQGKYDHTQPISDNRIAGVAFDIPSPSDLPDPPSAIEVQS